MITENLSTLKIHKLTQEQYNKELINNTLDENALYLTPEEDVDLSGYVTVEQLNAKADVEHTHDDSYDALGSADIALNSAKTYTDNKKNETVNEIMATNAGKIVTGTSAEIFNDYSERIYDDDSVPTGGNVADGNYSHAEGHITTVVGDCSHAEGYMTIIEGNYSHAEGHMTTAVGDCSHAEGYMTTANGNYSHAEGYMTFTGNYSHAEGYMTTAGGYQHVQGHYNNHSTATDGVNAGVSTGSAFVIGNGTEESGSNAFRVTYEGKPYSCSSMTTTGADYAEFFEWLDLNPNAEDRRGYFVTLDEDKIKIAEPNDYILGIVSALPAVIGNGDECWRGRYILDDFGAFIIEEFEYEEKIFDKEFGETKSVTKIGTKYKENPDYNPSEPYIQREDRPEWDTVGMMGVLAVRDDGTCKVNGYCKVANGGIATASETGYRVIKRVSDNVIKVVFR